MEISETGSCTCAWTGSQGGLLFGAAAVSYLPVAKDVLALAGLHCRQQSVSLASVAAWIRTWCSTGSCDQARVFARLLTERCV